AIVHKALRELDDTIVRMQHHQIVLEVQLNPHRPLDAGEVFRTLPTLAEAFRARLGPDRSEPITTAMDSFDYISAAWMLCQTVRGQAICLAPGEDGALARIERYLHDNQKPRD
ncbi:MAG: hypothetical protein ACRD0P_15305, partial [Stackebrandtia sp.]